MLRHAFYYTLKPLFQRSLWRWVTAMLLGLVTWWSVNRWLEPKPIWQIRFTESERSLLPEYEDLSGNRLLTMEKPADRNGGPLDAAALTYVILDANTGKTLFRLAPPEDQSRSLNGGRIVGDIYWFVDSNTDGNGTHFELRAWHFTQEDKIRVVKQWSIPRDTPYNIDFEHKKSPYFVVRTEWPWQPALATLMVDGWTGLTSILALQKGDDWLTAVVPWMRTYQLSAQSPEPPRLIASWTLTALRWCIPSISPDAKIIIVGDAFLPARWRYNTRQEYSNPPGVLLYDGHTGKQRYLADHHVDPSLAQKTEVWGNLIRLRSTTNPITFDLYDGVTGKKQFWPKILTEPSFIGKLFQDQITPNKAIFKEDDREYHVQWSPMGIEGFQLADLQKVENVEVSERVYLQDRFLACQSQTTYQPDMLIRLGQHWKWLLDKIIEIWPPVRTGLHFFDITTGANNWHILDVEGHRLDSTRHFYTTHYWKNDRTLQAWAIPFEFYSPWWGRTTGILACILILVFPSTKKPKTYQPT